MRFYLVDDNELGGNAVAFALEASGHQVTVERNGRRAIDHLITHRYDAIILDLTLGEIDGISVAASVRERSRSVPIIFTSGHETYPGLAAALNDSRTRMLHKPYDLATLLATLREVTRPREDGARVADRAAIH